MKAIYIVILGAGVFVTGLGILLTDPAQKWCWTIGMFSFLEVFSVTHLLSTRSKNSTASNITAIIAAVVIGVAIAATLWTHL